MIEGTNGINNTRGTFILPTLFHQMKSRAEENNRVLIKGLEAVGDVEKGGRKETLLGMLIAHSLPSWGNQKCLQMLANAPRGQNCL